MQIINEYTVSQLSNKLKDFVENEFAGVRVKGEVSGLKVAPSGHVYFSLKDNQSVLAAICWRGSFANLSFKPQDGMEIICIGNITTYPGQSKYQIIVDKIEEIGVGSLMILLEKRKQMFIAEGLFDTKHKKKLPFVPHKIAIITSPTGAVIRDIIHRIKDRFPLPILLWPVLVQGEKSAEQVADAINSINELEDKPDLIIVARGGGSIEDLWSFNEEIVIRAAFASTIPLISAIGHETDFTLLDFVADLRAPTPTAAAEMAVPVKSEILLKLVEFKRRSKFAIKKLFEFNYNKVQMLFKSLPNCNSMLNNNIQRLDDLLIRFLNSKNIFFDKKLNLLNSYSLLLKSPKNLILLYEQKLEQLHNKLVIFVKKNVQTQEHKFQMLSSLLESYSYKNILSRGFSILLDQSNQPIKSVNQITYQQIVKAKLHDGEVDLKKI